MNDCGSNEIGRGGEIRPARRKEGAQSTLRLDVPIEHGTAWFSTLNQARILLDLKYRLHQPRDAGSEAGDSTDGEAEPDPARMLVMMRYELYAWLQEWLVRHVL